MTVQTSQRSTERTAERLLRSTAARSFDPDLDIDWSAPLAEDKGFMLEHRCSLYGTAMWDGLSPAERIELGKHEAASIAGTGIWLEFILLRMLAKLVYDGDHSTPQVRYALAEMAEECRHSTMFARMIDKFGTPHYGPSAQVRRVAGMLNVIARGPAVWGAILLGEELTDRIQREQVNDEYIQPVMRMVNRIHIMEEARHIGFARGELSRAAAQASGAALRYHRLVLARAAYIVSRSLIDPRVYSSVGLDPAQARQVALANPHHQETLRFAGEKIVAVLDDAGLIGEPGMRLWRKSFLIAA